jgi:hypothetical protein
MAGAPALLLPAWCFPAVCTGACPLPFLSTSRAKIFFCAAEASTATDLDPHAVSVVIIKSLSTMRSPLIGSHVRSALLQAVLYRSSPAAERLGDIWQALQRMPQPQGRVLQVRRRLAGSGA